MHPEYEKTPDFDSSYLMIYLARKCHTSIGIFDLDAQFPLYIYT